MASKIERLLGNIEMELGADYRQELAETAGPLGPKASTNKQAAYMAGLLNALNQDCSGDRIAEIM